MAASSKKANLMSLSPKPIPTSGKSRIRDVSPHSPARLCLDGGPRVALGPVLAADEAGAHRDAAAALSRFLRRRLRDLPARDRAGLGALDQGHVGALLAHLLGVFFQ